MNREETWVLFQQGRDAWNAWAEDMLAKRKALEEVGEWETDSYGRPNNDATYHWFREATADFGKRAIRQDADFRKHIFPGDVRFSQSVFGPHVDFRGLAFREMAEFELAKFEGAADFEGVTFGNSVYFTDATVTNNALFNNTRFCGIASFVGTKFQGVAFFRKAEFKKSTGFERCVFDWDARFEESMFCRNVSFFGALFKQYAEFQDVRFDSDADFRDASFTEVAHFRGAFFRGAVAFVQATFDGSATFEGARFVGKSDFSAIQVKRSFLLADAQFDHVPAFIQAAFGEAPRLDQLNIGSSHRSLLDGSVLGNLFRPEPDLGARWRALKRLAIQTHDHSRELEYFSEELKARRWSSDWKRPFLLISGIIYQLVSGFGRSLFLPLFWLGAVLVFFGCMYLGNHRAYTDHEWAGFVWGWEKFTSYFDEREIPPEPCVVGPDASSAATAAAALALRNTIPFAGLGAPEKLNQVYRCLYGVEGTKTAGFPESRMPPRIPDNVAFLGMLQTIISAVLIFLFLLAVRNHFRIK